MGVRSWGMRAAYAGALTTLASAAAAQPTAPPSVAQSAEDGRAALYREGVEAASAGRWAEAKKRFAETLAMRASPKVFFSLAQAEEELGQLASAQADYESALHGAKTAGDAEVVGAAEQALRTLEPRVPHVVVVCANATGQTRALLDQRPIAMGTAVAVDPGTHHLAVSAPGARDVTPIVSVAERQRLEVPACPVAVVAPLPPMPAPPPPAATAGVPPPTAPEKPPGAPSAGVNWRTVGLVTAGAGVVGLGVGMAFGIVAKSKLDQSNSSGCNGNDCTASAAAVRRDSLSAANVSTAAFVVGGVLAAGGVVLWLLAPSGHAAGVGVTPVATVGGSGVMVAGRW
jgi:hypothetical protein